MANIGDGIVLEGNLRWDYQNLSATRVFKKSNNNGSAILEGFGSNEPWISVFYRIHAVCVSEGADKGKTNIFELYLSKNNSDVEATLSALRADIPETTILISEFSNTVMLVGECSPNFQTEWIIDRTLLTGTFAEVAIPE